MKQVKLKKKEYSVWFSGKSNKNKFLNVFSLISQRDFQKDQPPFSSISPEKSCKKIEFGDFSQNKLLENLFLFYFIF